MYLKKNTLRGVHIKYQFHPFRKCAIAYSLKNLQNKNTTKMSYTCETKQDTNIDSHSNTDPHLSYLVQPRLHGQRQRLPSLKALWICPSRCQSITFSLFNY